MSSPVPKHLRDESDYESIPTCFRGHVIDIFPCALNGNYPYGARVHRAKFASGLATELVRLAKSDSIGDPMAGVGTLVYETEIQAALNDIDLSMQKFLDPLAGRGCEVSYFPAERIQWKRKCCIFSPPYYPRTDRCVPNAHDDEKRGPVVGYRDSYSCRHPAFIGNPGGSEAIKVYRDQMTRVYRHLTSVCEKMVVVTKNWTRLGVELRLDLDTILMAESVGWRCTERHGWEPKPSLWARFNTKRGGGVTVEDILIFERR